MAGISEKVEKHAGGAMESWTQEQVRFVSYAQRAVRQAIYFTRLVDVDSRETDLLDHVRHSVGALLAGVRPVSGAAISPYAKAKDYSGAKEPFDELTQRWETLEKECAAATDAAKLQTLEEHLCEFLSASAPRSWLIRFTYTRLPALARALGQHLGFIVGLAIAFAILLGVEAVFSLFRQRWWYGLVAALLAALPGIALCVEGRRERRSRTPRWDVGGRVAREVRPTLVEPEPWAPWHPPKGNFAFSVYTGLVYKALLYLMTWVAGWLIVRTAVDLSRGDDTWLTVYLIAVMLAGIAFVGAAIDFVDIHSEAPVREIILGGVLVLGLAILCTDSTIWLLLWPGAWTALVFFWVWRIEQKRASIALLVIYAGVVAAHLTTTSRIDARRWRKAENAPTVSFIGPHEWPAGGDSGAPVVVMAASGGGSRAAIMVAHTLQALRAQHPRIAENLQAISSVSGGSLATAAYVARTLRTDTRDSAGVPLCDASLLDAVDQDFLFPTLFGVIRHLGGRATAIQRAWEECPTGLGALRIGELADIWRTHDAGAPGKTSPFAVPIFNSTSLDRHDVVITPLAGQFFLQPLDAFARDPQRTGGAQPGTWVHYRSGIYHLGDFGKHLNPTLSEAVHASASFPFGFPLVEVETRERLWYSPRPEELDSSTVKVVRLTDGGALSNSGLWPLLPLLLNKRETIRPRGLLLIIVDAGRMPKIGTTDRQRGLLQTLFDKAPKSERSHFQMLEQLGHAYADCFAFVQIAVNPLKKNNIYTTWALDQRSRALLDTLFADSWRVASPQLTNAFESLGTCKKEPRLPLAKRVPVD